MEIECGVATIFIQENQTYNTSNGSHRIAFDPLVVHLDLFDGAPRDRVQKPVELNKIRTIHSESSVFAITNMLQMIMSVPNGQSR